MTRLGKLADVPSARWRGLPETSPGWPPKSSVLGLGDRQFVFYLTSCAAKICAWAAGRLPISNPSDLGVTSPRMTKAAAQSNVPSGTRHQQVADDQRVHLGA